MWILGKYLPISRELLYGIGFLLFLMVIAIGVIIAKRRKKSVFSTNQIFRGKNLDRIGKNKKDLTNYDDMPIVDLKWQDKNDIPSSYSNYGGDNEDDDEDKIDDGYTVVEKTIQEKAQQLQFTPPKQSSQQPPPLREVKKEIKPPVKKDATGDKMDFFTTNKNAL